MTMKNGVLSHCKELMLLSNKQASARRLGPRAIMTTQAWLDDYLAGRWERKPKEGSDEPA